MQLGFGPGDDEAFIDGRVQLMDELQAWAVQRGLDVEIDPVRFALDAKLSHLDGRMTRWRVADLDELLTELAPRRLSADDTYVAAVVPALRVFLRQLDDTGRLAEGSDTPAQLDRALTRLELPFRAAMADPSHPGPAKALFAILQARGVDLHDPDAVQRTVDELNALPFEERAALLPLPPEPDPEPAPPVTLPDDDELAALAAATPLLARLRTVASFYGEGRKLTAAGNTTPADGRELARLLDSPDAAAAATARSAARLPHVSAAVELAREARLLKRAHGVQSATRRARALDARPLTAWREAFDALLALGPTLLSTGVQQFRPYWAHDLDEDAAGVLELLYRTGTDMPVNLLIEAFGEAAGEDPNPLLDAEHVRDLVTLSLLQLLDGLELAGAVERATSVIDTGEEVWEGEVVRLAPLGRWFVRGVLLERGEPAPLAGDLAGEDAVTLLATVGGYPPEPAEEEIRGWIAHREPAAATAELADAVRAAQDPPQRMGAAGALTLLPDDAEPAIRALRDDPLLRPHAILWLIDRDLEPPSALSPTDHADHMVETLAAVLIATDPAEVVAQLQDTASDPRALLDLPEAIRHVDSPHTDHVLSALAEASDPTLAKAARRAQFKRRSSRPR